MVRFFVVPVLFFPLAVGLSAPAQTASGGNLGANNPSVPPSPTIPDAAARRPFMSGKVIVDDGTPLTDPAAIQSDCKGRVRTEGFTDSRGRFSFDVSAPRDVAVDQASDSSQTLLGQAPSENSRGVSPGRTADHWRDCKLQAVLPGFTSAVLELSGKLPGSLGTTDVGTIVLHRTEQVQGFTISATSARAPAKARKEYERGLDLEKKEKWDAALQSFQEAVQLYPEYAVAWFEMGRVQIQKGDPGASRESLHRALSADSKLVSPYHELAQLAARDRRWQEVVDTTDALLKLNAVDFPHDWMLNAVGHFYLQQLDAAEKSARRGLELDKQHRFPRLEYLLGLVLAQRQDFTGALEHMRNYLHLSPAATDSQTVQKQIEDLEQLSAKSSVHQ